MVAAGSKLGGRILWLTHIILQVSSVSCSMYFTCRVSRAKDYRMADSGDFWWAAAQNLHYGRHFGDVRPVTVDCLAGCYQGTLTRLSSSCHSVRGRSESE